MRYRICWITLCRNEMDILPYVKEYWERLGVDKVVVYDNGSDDGSIEYLSKLSYVEIRHFDSAGQNDIIQKTIKEKAYLELKGQYDIIILSDLDEVFCFNDFEKVLDEFVTGGYDILATPLYSLCEDYKPMHFDGVLLHSQCHKFFKQRMNHMQGFEEISKLSIFNCKTVDSINMSVGQHYVYTNPNEKIMLCKDGFGLHFNKGFGIDYFLSKRNRMGKNLSETNRSKGMCNEYLKSEDESIQEYKDNQSKSFDLNDLFH